MPRRLRSRASGQMLHPTKKVTKAEAVSKTKPKQQARQILKVQKQVTSLSRQIRDNTKWTHFQHAPSRFSFMPLLQATGGIFVMPLVTPTGTVGYYDGWTRCFSSTPEDMTTLKWRGRSMQTSVLIQLAAPEVEPDPVMFSCYIVSLRPETAQQVYNETTDSTQAIAGGMRQSKMVAGEHYIRRTLSANPLTGQGDGLPFINPSMFNVHWKAHGITGGRSNFQGGEEEFENATTSLKDNNWIRTAKLPYKRLLKADGSGAGNHWSTLTYPNVQLADQRYFICIPNNYGAQAIDIFLHTLFTGKNTN